ncbi:MAG: DNA polymerase III subunit chi [Holosporales bacterium]|jgi:DNA polymerase IIIc chi subunit|nr:DNA polymerase III subunit chi [Holosporales bacterium]
MPDKNVTFYSIDSEFLQVACKLIEKMYLSGERILFLCDNEEEISFYNSKLWTFSKLSFIPSGNEKSIFIEDAKFCYIWFSTNMAFYNEPTCLLHNGLEILNYKNLERFKKIVDIFRCDSISDAKARSIFYEESGFSVQRLWIQSQASWTAGNL